MQALLVIGIIHGCLSAVLFHSNFESEGFHVARPVEAGSKTIELLPHGELELWWPQDGGKGIIAPEFPKHRELFEYKARNGLRLEGVVGISKNHDKWTSVHAWGLAEWYAEERVIQARTHGKIELDPNIPISGTHSALFRTDFDSSAILHHRMTESPQREMNASFVVRFATEVTRPWSGHFPLLHCRFGDRLAPHVAITRQEDAGTIQFAYAQRPFVEFVREQHSSPIPVVGGETYKVETRFEPKADSVYICSLRVNGKVQSVVTSLHRQHREKKGYWVALGKIADASYPASFWLDNILLSDTPLGRIPNQPSLSCSSAHLVAVAEKGRQGNARAAHWQISAGRNWLLPAFSTGHDPLHVWKLPPLQAISIGRRSMEKLVFETSVPLPFMIPKSGQYWARLRHMNPHGVWGPWSRPLAIEALWPQSGRSTGMPRIDNAYFTQPGQQRRITRINSGSWYDLHFRFPPKAAPTFLDVCLNGNQGASAMSYHNRGGVFRARDNYIVSLDLANKAVWTIENEGSAEHIMLLGDLGKYVDDTDGRSWYDAANGKARARIRLSQRARKGTWKLLAYMGSQSGGVSPIFQDLVYVEDRKKADQTPSSSIRIFAGIGMVASAAILVTLVYLLLQAIFRWRKPDFSSIDSIKPADEYRNPLVKKSIEYIQGNLGSPISLRDVADAVGISPGRLGVAFRDETGCSVLEYVHAVKIRKAQEMLRSSDLSANDIALQVGFNSITSFNRAFRRYSNTTPLAYRKNRQ